MPNAMEKETKWTLDQLIRDADAVKHYGIYNTESSNWWRCVCLFKNALHKFLMQDLFSAEDGCLK